MFKAYADSVKVALQSCAAIATHSLQIVELSPNTGYLEGEALFVDGSRWIFFEFLRQSGSFLNREKYRYHYMDVHDQVIFRYDNAPHHPTIATFPHHKHTPAGVIDSSTPAFAAVLAEIEQVIYGLHR